MIHIKNIYQSYDVNKPILQGVSLYISQGNWISIVGRSGSGKITLLQCMAGLLMPSKGTVEYDNKDILALSKDERCRFRRKNIGFVFQDYKLIPYYSAIENVMVPFIHDMKRPILRERTEAVLSQIGFSSNLFKSLPHQLSGGEKQRVAIARAMVNNPKIIVCDEPTGNLDIDSRDIIVNVLMDLRKMGQTIVVVTHDLEIAENSDSIFTLKEGKLFKNEERYAP